jgi:hypothetical protein
MVAAVSSHRVVGSVAVEDEAAGKRPRCEDAGVLDRASRAQHELVERVGDDPDLRYRAGLSGISRSRTAQFSNDRLLRMLRHLHLRQDVQHGDNGQ